MAKKYGLNGKYPSTVSNDIKTKIDGQEVAFNQDVQMNINGTNLFELHEANNDGSPIENSSPALTINNIDGSYVIGLSEQVCAVFKEGMKNANINDEHLKTILDEGKIHINSNDRAISIKSDNNEFVITIKSTDGKEYTLTANATGIKFEYGNDTLTYSSGKDKHFNVNMHRDFATSILQQKPPFATIDGENGKDRIRFFPQYITYLYSQGFANKDLNMENPTTEGDFTFFYGQSVPYGSKTNALNDYLFIKDEKTNQVFIYGNGGYAECKEFFFTEDKNGKKSLNINRSDKKTISIDCQSPKFDEFFHTFAQINLPVASKYDDGKVYESDNTIEIEGKTYQIYKDNPQNSVNMNFSYKRKTYEQEGIASDSDSVIGDPGPDEEPGDGGGSGGSGDGGGSLGDPGPDEKTDDGGGSGDSGGSGDGGSDTNNDDKDNDTTDQENDEENENKSKVNRIEKNIPGRTVGKEKSYKYQAEAIGLSMGIVGLFLGLIAPFLGPVALFIGLGLTVGGIGLGVVADKLEFKPFNIADKTITDYEIQEAEEKENEQEKANEINRVVEGEENANNLEQQGEKDKQEVINQVNQNTGKEGIVNNENANNPQTNPQNADTHQDVNNTAQVENESPAQPMTQDAQFVQGDKVLDDVIAENASNMQAINQLGATSSPVQSFINQINSFAPIYHQPNSTSSSTQTGAENNTNTTQENVYSDFLDIANLPYRQGLMQTLTEISYMSNDDTPRTKGIIRKVKLPTKKELRDQKIRNFINSFYKTDMTEEERAQATTVIEDLFKDPVVLNGFIASVDKLNNTQAQERELLQQQKNLLAEMDNEMLGRVYNHPDMNAEKRDILDKRYGAEILKSRANNDNVASRDNEGLLNIVPEEERENHAKNLEQSAKQIEDDLKKIKEIAKDNVAEVKHVKKLSTYNQYISEDENAYAKRSEAEESTLDYLYSYTQNYYNVKNQSEIEKLKTTEIGEKTTDGGFLNLEEYNACKDIQSTGNDIVSQLIDISDKQVTKFTETHKSIYEFIETQYIEEITDLYLGDPDTSILPTSNGIIKHKQHTIENIALSFAKNDLISLLQKQGLNDKNFTEDKIRSMTASELVKEFNITIESKDGKDILKINNIEIQNADKAINAVKLTSLNNQYDDNYKDLVNNLPTKKLLDNMQKLGVSPSKEQIDKNLAELQEKYPFVKTLNEDQQRDIAKLNISVDEAGTKINENISKSKTEIEILRQTYKTVYKTLDNLANYDENYNESVMKDYQQQLQKLGLYPDKLSEAQAQEILNKYPNVSEFKDTKKDYFQKLAVASKNLQNLITEKEKILENDEKVAKQVVNSLKSQKTLLTNLLNKSVEQLIFTQTTHEALREKGQYRDKINLRDSKKTMLSTHKRFKHIDEVFKVFADGDKELLKEFRNSYNEKLQASTKSSAGDIVKDVLRDKIGKLTIDGRSFQDIISNSSSGNIVTEADIQKFVNDKLAVINQQTQSRLQTGISTLDPEYVQEEFNAQRNAILNPQRLSAENMMQAVIESGLADMDDIVKAFSNPDLEQGLKGLLRRCGFNKTEIDAIINARFLSNDKALYRTFNSSQKDYIQAKKRIELLNQLKEIVQERKVPEKELIKTCKSNGIKIDRKTIKAFRKGKTELLLQQIDAQINMAQFEADNLAKTLDTNTEQEGRAKKAEIDNKTFNKQSDNYSKRLDQIIKIAQDIAGKGPHAYGLTKHFLMAVSKGDLQEFAKSYPQIDITEIKDINKKEIDQYQSLGLSLKEVEKIAKVMKESGDGKISAKRVRKALDNLKIFRSDKQENIQMTKSDKSSKQKTEKKKLKKERKENGPKKMEYKNRESFLARLFRIKNAAQEKVKEEQDRKREAAEERERQAAQEANREANPDERTTEGSEANQDEQENQ